MFGKGTLIMIAAFGILFAFINSTRFRSMVEVSGQAANYQYETLSRKAAKTGYAIALQAMSDGSESGLVEGILPDGKYRTVLSSAGARYRIESQGRMHDTRSMPLVWTIRAEYERLPNGTPDDVPPFMDYVLMSQGDLELAGSPDIDLSANPYSNAVNANVHTNSSLKISGNKVRISGFGTYVGTASSNPADALTTSFSPTVNEFERPEVGQVEEITIPEFTVANYLDNVQVDQVSGPVTLSGDYNFGGTRENPHVWHVQGDLEATGGVTISGYVMFLVEGNISMTGNVSAGMDTAELTESTMAFYSAGDISFHGTVDIYGQFFADGNFEVNGTPTLYGSVTTRGSAVLKGTPNLNYVKASPALTQIWNDDALGLYRLLSYHEAKERIAEDKVDLFAGDL